jgi:cysteinyl-tRNA synthetase
MAVQLYNTMAKALEEFRPMDNGNVGMYACGPTVYTYAHIGNLRTYIFEDVLRRVLEYSGYSVKHVMNITDVGHLVGDNDEGEDKMLKSSRQTGKSVYEIAEFYTDAFFTDTDKLHIERPSVACKATDHIQDMIALIQRLEERGYTYMAGGNVYFSIDAFKEYGKLARLDLEELRSGARIEVDENKRNPKDFALWFTKSKFEHQAMVWDSPWGRGYPGWHLECSAMSMKYLGEQFDIHCGGTDHIPVHHTNEIAQSEAATGKSPWVRYWLHGEFLIDDTGKMSKSKGEFLTLSLLEKKGYDPMDYRYFCLGGHYRSQLQFSFPALDGAKKARENLVDRISQMLSGDPEIPPVDALGNEAKELKDEFASVVQRDLNTPRALAVMWKIVKHARLPVSEKLALLYDIDKVLGLGLDTIEKHSSDELAEELKDLIAQREQARKEKDFAKADEIRDLLAERGVEIRDTPLGTQWKRIV